ncbi:MAG: transcriptional regulator [Myxococcaceae bacterium]|nr:transcriptional regulator [Myxococcaceae bacterium]
MPKSPKPPAPRLAESAARNEQVVRILRILHQLDRLGGRTLYELAEENGTTTRTIRRDFDAIQEAGIPLLGDSGDDGKKRWRIASDASTRLTSLLDASHFLALRIAMDESVFVKRSDSLFSVLEDLALRVEKALGAKGRRQLAELDQCFFSWEKFAWRQAPPDVVWPLISAITRRNACVVTYRAPSSGNKERRFRMLPLRLLVHNGALYLHAWHAHFATVLLLNLQRLKTLEVLDEVEPLPPDYDPKRLEDSAFGVFIGKGTQTFVLDFDAFARPYIEERTWHPSETREDLPDGGLRLRMACTPSYEVTNWVASWREHVRVVEPAALRDELATYGRFLRASYGEGPDAPAPKGPPRRGTPPTRRVRRPRPADASRPARATVKR